MGIQVQTMGWSNGLVTVFSTLVKKNGTFQLDSDLTKVDLFHP